MIKIKAPIILFSRSRFVVVPEEGLRVLGLKMPTEGILLMNASAKKDYREPPGWMMEADGTFRQFSPEKSRYTVPAAISDFLGLTKIEFTSTPPRTITIAEFRGILKHSGRQKDRQLSYLLEHLDGFHDDQTVDCNILATWPI